MWQVIGYEEPIGRCRATGRPIVGPLPRKRWVAQPGDPKPRKVKPKIGRPSDCLSKREYNERKARQYAEWLAARDGIGIDGWYRREVRFDWRSVTLPHKTRRQRFWNGTQEVQATEPRIAAVMFGRKEERFNTRKDGRRGAYVGSEFVAETTIEIPHWDHVPDCIDEHDAVDVAA